MLAKLRAEIRAIPQGTVQKALNTIVEILEIMDAEDALLHHKESMITPYEGESCPEELEKPKMKDEVNNA